MDMGPDKVSLGDINTKVERIFDGITEEILAKNQPHESLKLGFVRNDVLRHDIRTLGGNRIHNLQIGSKRL